MKEIAVGNRYALAIYEIAKELNRVEDMYKELKIVMETYELNIDFKNFINHPLVKKDDKKEFISKVFSKEVSGETMNLLHYLIDKTRLAQIKAIVTEYLKLYYERNQIVEAEATFAVEPTKEQVEKLVSKLQAKIKKEVRISTKIDKAILGGVVIRIGDQIIDASIKKEIEAFRNNY